MLHVSPVFRVEHVSCCSCCPLSLWQQYEEKLPVLAVTFLPMRPCHSFTQLCVCVNELRAPISFAAVSLQFSMNYHCVVEHCVHWVFLSVDLPARTGCMGTQIYRMICKRPAWQQRYADRWCNALQAPKKILPAQKSAPIFLFFKKWTYPFKA